MRGALVIFAAMVVIGVLLFVTDVVYYRRKDAIKKSRLEASPEGEDKEADASSGDSPHGEICCGTHLICEKTSLSPLSDEIIYYDDEELDRFKGREAGSYTDEEADEFRDVLLTLLPQDVAGWARSITLRGIELPADVRDELLMIVREQRLPQTTEEFR